MTGETSIEQKQLQAHETLVFKGRLLPQLPTEYIEKSLENPLIVPYGAVPANLYRDEETKLQQAMINESFQMLYETPPSEMPREFVDHVVVNDYIINENRRMIENFNVYTQFMASDTEIDPTLFPEIDRFESGHATIEEIARIASHSDIPSVEFGKVTHPYGYRMQYIDPFRTDMSQAIEAQGGVVYPDIAPYRSIKILPRVLRADDGTEFGRQRIIGFIVKYKRDYGHIPVAGSKDEVVRVVERQIAAYRVDEASGFDQSVLDAMHALREEYPKRIHWDAHVSEDGKDRKVFTDRLHKTGCLSFIENAVQHESLEDFVVPISTTIYGHREKLPEKKKLDSFAKTAIERALNESLSRLQPSVSDAHHFDY